MTDPLALYRKACVSHKRADWRIAAHALAKALEASMRAEKPLPHKGSAKAGGPLDPPAGLHVAKPQPIERLRRGQTLIQFLAERGIRDDGGEVSSLDGESWHRLYPFRRKLVRDDGLGLEEAAERAWAAGYFPEVVEPSWTGCDNMQPLSAGELVEAIRAELAGRPRYSGDGLVSLDDDSQHFMEPEESQ